MEVHRLAVGQEVDFQAVDSIWLPARVEALENGGNILKLRYSTGIAYVTATVDLRKSWQAARVAAAGGCRFRKTRPAAFLLLRSPLSNPQPTHCPDCRHEELSAGRQATRGRAQAARACGRTRRLAAVGPRCVAAREAGADATTVTSAARCR